MIAPSTATVPGWLDQRAAGRANHPAIIDAAEALSYGALLHRAAAVAEHLSALGLQRGDRIAAVLPNTAAFAMLLHGAMRGGFVLVPLDPRLAPGELGERIRRAGAAVLVRNSADAERACAMIRDTPCAAVDLEAIAGGAGAVVTPARHQLSAPCSIIFTSGSTGTAKGVVLTYGNHLWSAVGSAFQLGVSRDDRWLACLPFCHVGGLSILLRCVLYGITAIVHERFDANDVNRAIDAQHVTIVSVVPAMLRRLLDARGDRAYPPWLRCLLVGGAPVPPALLAECDARGLPIAQTYGLTEAASQVATLSPRNARRKLGSAGTALLGTEIRLVEAGHPVAAGAVGEIQIRGPSIAAGYAGDPQPVCNEDGWLATRDLGRFDDEGFLYVLGRGDDVIISGGENVHPVEVETVLHSHPTVAEACVAGLPDPEWGTAVTAWVRLRPGAAVTAPELREHARRSLAGFKVPRMIHFVTDFPRTAAGKIARHALPGEKSTRIGETP